MKTTIEIPDSLFAEATACVQSKGVPFRQLVEEGLRALIQQNRKSRGEFHLKDGYFGGEALSADVSWAEIRRVIYSGRGE